MMARRIPESKWIKEIPFDVAEWGDKEGYYADGKPLFESEAAFQQALKDAKKLPKRSEKPAV